MPLWAHGIDPMQHLYLLRVVFVVGAMFVGASLARGLDGAWRWLAHRPR
jgi:hypothetical protein